MNKIIFILLFMLVPVYAIAQASGGQIRRSNPTPTKEVKQTPKRNVNQKNKGEVTRSKKTIEEYKLLTPTDDQTISLNSLATFNVVIFSAKNLEVASEKCSFFRNKGYPSVIYRDPNLGNYLIIAGRTDFEQEASLLKKKIRKDNYSAWILYIVNGVQEMYNK